MAALRSVLLLCVLLAATIIMFIIGAVGPPVTKVEQFLFGSCVLPSANNHVLQKGHQPIHRGNCKEFGKELEAINHHEKLDHHPGKVIYYLTLPVKRNHRTLSRWFQFLMGDLEVVFTTDLYPRELAKKDNNRLSIEVALYYRDDYTLKWRLLASSNVTRVLDCQLTSYDFFSCDHLPLFELGSCHYHHYLINLRFPSLPLNHRDDFRGSVVIDKLNLFAIHQTSEFTYQWFIFKVVVFPLSLISLIYLLHQVSQSTSSISLIHKSLLFLNCSLVFYNTPVEVLTLWVDMPWALVFGDFRQGLFILSLLIFWVVYVGEHLPKSSERRDMGIYWKQILVAGIGTLFLFTYEFCERGVQVFNPFFTLWGSHSSRLVANCFLVISFISVLLYLIMLLNAVWKVYQHMKQRLSSSEELSHQSRDKIKAALSELKYFLFLTVFVAALSVCGYVLPTEIFLMHSIHGNTDLSLYGALMFGNYGLWNMYTFVMTIYSSPYTVETAPSSTSGNLAAAYNVMTKTSQE